MSKIDLESAELDFGKMCEFFSVDVSDLGREEAEDMEAYKTKCVRAIRKGTLTIADDGQPTFATNEGTPLVFKAPTGATLLINGGKKAPDDQTRKLFAMVSELTGGGVPPSKLNLAETGVVLAIVGVFMTALQ